MEKKLIKILLLICLLPVNVAQVWAEPIRVAVASNFVEVANAIVERFSEQQGVEVQISAGSSGKLFAQIRHGAPYDLFLSADQQKPRRLMNANLADVDSRVTYARGRLVLMRYGASLPTEPTAILRSEDVTRIAIANPDLAPYGAAARGFLLSKQLLQDTQRRWVMGENIAQTFQFVYTGNAQVGFVAASQIKVIANDPRFSYWLIPQHQHPAINQDMVILQRSADKDAVNALWHFIQGDVAKNIIRTFGYDV